MRSENCAKCPRSLGKHAFVTDNGQARVCGRCYVRETKRLHRDLGEHDERRVGRLRWVSRWNVGRA